MRCKKGSITNVVAISPFHTDPRKQILKCFLIIPYGFTKWIIKK